MAFLVHSIDDTRDREALFVRMDRLDPAEPPRWGKLSAPRMIVHLCDQMRMPFNDNPSGTLPGPPRVPVLREAALYWLPWPRGTIAGPPEAFCTEPGNWSDDIATLKKLVVEFVNGDPKRSLSRHPNWGRLTRRQWGIFCYRHFDHHLKQFGV